MRRIYSLLTLIVALMFSGNAMAAEVLTFPSYNDTGVGSYTAEWTATVNGKTWNINGFNNNNNDDTWTFIRAGRKNVEHTATITSPAIDAVITDVVFTVDVTSLVSSATLDVLNGEEVVKTIDITNDWVAGETDVKVEGAAGYSYRLTLNSASASANGTTQISKIALYEANEYEAPVGLTAVSDKVWTFSDFEKGNITTTSIVDNLKICGSSKMAVDENPKSIDDFSFTKRLKFGGTGNSSAGYVSFRVAPNSHIIVYGMSGSSGSERIMNIDSPQFGTTVAKLTNDGTAIGKAEFDYEGETDTYVYLYSSNSGFNIYGIVVTPIESATPLPEAPEIINPSFELAAADTPLTEDLKASNGPLTIYGWTEEVNTSFNNTEILKSGNTASSQFGSSEASDGEYALFFRHGWNESGTTNTFTSTALATLPAGSYRLSVDYKQHYSYDNSQNSNTTVGIAMMNGETELGSAKSEGAAGVQGGNADATYFNDSEWSTLEALFTVEEAVEGATVVISLNAAGQRRSDFFIDNVKLERVSEEELAKGELEEEIEKAKAELEKYPAGENFFQYAEDELKPMNDAIEAAETALNDEAATAESLKAALESLKAAEETFAPEQTEPVDGQAYILSLTTSEGTFQLNIEGTNNTIAEEGTPVYLVKQENGTYAITPDNENYVVYAGGNNWTMSTSTTPYGFTFAALADGGYSITGKNGFYGTNKGGGDAAGSAVYGDKNTGNGNYIWNIAEAEDDKDPNDMTDLIVNPAYLHEGDDGTADYAGWTWSPAPGESGWKYRDFDEPMNLVTYSGNVKFSFEQTIPEVPAGQYRLSVYGFYRAGSAQDEADRVANGDVTHNLLMFAEVGDAIFTQPIMNLYEGATSEDVTGKNNHCVVNGYTDLFVPDGASDSREFFIAGYYRNDLIVNITEAGEMKIGINHPTGMTYDSDYAPIGAWELYRIGDAEEEVTLLGDVNKDNKISIVDATMTVEFALEKATPTAYQRKAADYDENQEIDVVDAALILQAVMNFDYDASGTKAREYVSNDYLVVNGNSIALENNDTYVAFQMDITVDGEFNGVELSARAADHHIAYNQIGENKYRVIVLSNSNSAFSGNAGELINLNVNGTYELSNIRFVDSEIRPVFIGVDNTATGIGSVRALEAGAEGIYTLGGVKVNALQKGVNIVRKADGTTVKVLVK